MNLTLKRAIVVMACAVIGVGGYLIFLELYSKSILSTEIIPTTETSIAEPTAHDMIVLRVSSMSIDEKIGQLLIVGFERPYVDDHIRTMITQYHIGGINLLARNIQNASQTQKLTTDLQASSAIPLFIATDQEGGVVVRFTFLNQLTPQIKIQDSVQAEKVAFERGIELKNLGVNMNFSPVLDFVSNSSSYLYSRTFGMDVQEISKFGRAMIVGYQKSGIVPVAKHFPGYGDLFTDPHTHAVTLKISEAELERNLSSFKDIASANAVGAIMTAHIVIPTIDQKPATLSHKFLSDILRNQYGFKGVIITDDMEMVSAGGSSTAEMSVEAIEAGVDMIISTYTPAKHIQIFEALKSAVISGRISEERINESVVRVLELKSSL